MTYKLPNPDTNPAAALVLSYKTFKGVEYDNRAWDAENWGRCMKRAVSILDAVKTLKNADRCMMDIGKKLDDAGLPWTLETVSRQAHEWAIKNIGRENANGLSARARFFADLAKSRTEGTGDAGGEGDAGAAISSMLRSHAAPASERFTAAVDGQPHGRDGDASGKVVEEKNDGRP